MSALDVIRSATATTRTVTMCLDGALQAEWDAALEAIDNTDDATGSLAAPAVTAAVEHLDSLRGKVQASEVTFLFDAGNLAWTEYIAMQADHEPREGNLLDRIRGFNVETFYPALIRATCKTVSSAGAGAEEMTEDAWVVLLGKPATDDEPAVRPSLNLKQTNNLIAAADYVMNGETSVPPSARSLLESRDFGASLAQPSPGTSAPDASEDGSRPGSPRSSTKPKASTPAGSPAT